MAKQKSLLVNLASFIEVSIRNGDTDNTGFQSLLFYRRKYKDYKQHIGLYNMVMGDFAGKGNLNKINEVLKILKLDGISCNPQSYAAIFECIGRLDETADTLALLKKFQAKAAEDVICFVYLKRKNENFYYFLLRVLRSMTSWIEVNLPTIREKLC